MRISARAFGRTGLALFVAAGLAALLAAAVVARLEPAHPSPQAAVEPASTQGAMPCQYHVMIIHDVHWAAACMKNAPPDDVADCMLPPERAAALDAAQDEAERFCRRRG